MKLCASSAVSAAEFLTTPVNTLKKSIIINTFVIFIKTVLASTRQSVVKYLHASL